jgi:hypothetical protein
VAVLAEAVCSPMMPVRRIGFPQKQEKKRLLGHTNGASSLQIATSQFVGSTTRNTHVVLPTNLDSQGLVF